VAIFRGVNTQFGPLKFFNVYKNTDLDVQDLEPAVRSQVDDGITAHNESDAEQIVARLHDQLLPICRIELPVPTASTTPTSTRSRSGASTPAGARSTAKTTAKSTPKPTAKSSARTSPSPTPSDIPTQTPEPDVNCRAA
jgi:protein phosphatase